MTLAGFRPADVFEERFSVSFDYPVVFCQGAFVPADPTLVWAIARREPARRHAVCVAVDSGLSDADRTLIPRLLEYFRAHALELELRGEPFRVQGGEASKNDPSVVSELQRFFAQQKLDRQSVVLVVGGGAVLDAVGYAASTIHRGVRVVRMPSTVLAQSDGGVGVKTGVNAFGAKNFIGTFAPPYAVVNDAELLRTLPLRVARAGMAEAVKVALIRDAALFDWLELNARALSRAEPGPLAELIARAARLHLRHIAEAGDPFELGSARPLDYGHWAAHKLEILSQHDLYHGEAVAIGMLLDARYAEQKGLLATRELERIGALLEALGLPSHHPALTGSGGGRLNVLAGLEEFREHLGGALTITLLRGIGRSFEVSEMDTVVVERAIAWLQARAGVQ
jgi:3-dehydroquinate synthase